MKHVHWKWSTAATLSLCLATPSSSSSSQTGPSATSSRKSSQWLQVEPSASSSQLLQFQLHRCSHSDEEFLQSWGQSPVSVPSTALHLGAGHRTRRMKLQEKLSLGLTRPEVAWAAVLGHHTLRGPSGGWCDKATALTSPVTLGTRTWETDASCVSLRLSFSKASGFCEDT